MKRLAVLLFMFGLSGCDVMHPEWPRAAYTYTCTEEQHDRVMKEAKEFYEQGKGYHWNFAYGSAIVRICEKKGE